MLPTNPIPGTLLLLPLSITTRLERWALTFITPPSSAPRPITPIPEIRLLHWAALLQELAPQSVEALKGFSTILIMLTRRAKRWT